MAGRPPKPTELLLLSGAARKNPKRLRARANEPVSPGPVGGPPQRWMIFHPAEGYQDAEKLRAIWDNCVKMWPWVTFSDRDALEHYCKLKLKDDKNLKMSGSELGAMLRIRSELGGTGSGRARLGVRAVGTPASNSPAKSTDPRASFLLRKSG
jgi:hypothetical protein